jgi:hypothetical protein
MPVRLICKELSSAFSFGHRGAKEKAWQKERRRFCGAARSTPRQRGFLKKAPLETEKHWRAKRSCIQKAPRIIRGALVFNFDYSSAGT